MNLNEVRDLVDRAIADLAPRGVENAWDCQDGTVLKWVDIRAALEPVVGFAEVPGPERIRGKRANDIIADEVTMPVEPTPEIKVE
jgi:hypothetical protein